MSQSPLSDVATHLREQAAAYCASSKIPGYLAGVYHGGTQVVVAHGVTNMVTGAPMVEDSGFLFGSVTKLLTTTLVLQHVERGVIDLDERVITYVPEFTLTTPEVAEQIRVRHLLSHTNGIDADLFFLDTGVPMRSRPSSKGLDTPVGCSSGQTSTSATLMAG